MVLGLAVAAMVSERDEAFRDWGLEALTVLQREFAFTSAPGYCESVGEGASKQPVFNWGVGVLMSTMSAAARVDPAWRTELKRFVEATRAYWNPAGPVAGYDVLPLPKDADRFYDDNAWMALALVEAYGVLRDPAVLGYANQALAFALSGEDSKLGGGIYWRERLKESKNTCSNAPVVAACLAVFAETGESRLLEKAKALYAWTKATLQDPADLLMWDSLALSGKKDETKWSYNTGLMVRSAAELARLTGEKHYRKEADAMAAASEKRWLVAGRLADAGRFAHLLVESWNYVPNDKRRKRARAALQWLHDHGRNDRGLYANRFDLSPSPYYKRFELIDQASAARAFLVVK